MDNCSETVKQIFIQKDYKFLNAYDVDSNCAKLWTDMFHEA